MYTPYFWPPMYPPNVGGQNEDPLTTYMRFKSFMEEEDKKKKDSDKNKKKPEPPKFSFLETWGLCLTLGPIIGIGYLYTIKYMLIQVEHLVR